MTGGRPIDGFVLAGGAGSRMGVDKARLAWGGAPMAAVVARIVAQRCRRVALVRRGVDALPWPGLELVVEPDRPDRHPLWGVAAALQASTTALAMIVPCDLPWLTLEAVDALLPGPAVAAVDGRRHPLVAVLPRTAASRALALAAVGGSATRFTADVPAVELPPDALRNVNRPADRPTSGPVATLLDGLPWLTAAARARIEAGERGRLAARGMVDVRYPPAPRREDG